MADTVLYTMVLRALRVLDEPPYPVNVLATASAAVCESTITVTVTLGQLSLVALRRISSEETPVSNEASWETKSVCFALLLTAGLVERSWERRPCWREFGQGAAT